MKFDWDFVVKDCHGDLAAIRRRVERHFREIRSDERHHAGDLIDWIRRNLPDMECRGDEDCDHCDGLGLLADYDKREADVLAAKEGGE